MTPEETQAVAVEVAERVAARGAARWVWCEFGDLLGTAFIAAMASLETWSPDGGASPATWAWARAIAAVEKWAYAEWRRRRRFTFVETMHAAWPDARHVSEERAQLLLQLERAALSHDEARALVSWAWGESGKNRARRHGTAESTESRRLGDALDLIGAERGRATTAAGTRKDRHERARRTYLDLGACA